MQSERQTSNLETDVPSKRGSSAETSEKDAPLETESDEKQNSNSTLMGGDEYSKQCVNLQLPKDTHRRKRYRAPLETIDECDIYDMFDSYSSSTISSSTSGSECDESITLPLLKSDDDEDITTLFCMDDWIREEEEEPTHDPTPDEILLTSSKSQSIKTKKRSSHIPLVIEATSSSVALLKYACRNHQYEKSLMEKHQPDSPGGDRKCKDHGKAVRPSIPPALGAPDVLPQILQDEYPPIDTINTVRKHSVINEHENDEDIAIDVLPKESVMNIQILETPEPRFENEHNTDETKETGLTKQESITSLSLQSLLKEIEENDSDKGSELTMLGLNNMLNVLVMKMTEKINQVIDVAATNNQVIQMKTDRKQKKNLQRVKKNPTNMEDTTASFINFPKRCNSENCGTFQQYRNTEILQELIQLVTTTITQLKLITQGTITSDCTSTCPTVFINTSAGPATATILSGDEFFMNPLCISSDNESESFLDFDLMYRKICMAEVESDMVNTDESSTNNAMPQISFPALGQENGKNIRSKSNPDTNTCPDDLITFDNNSLLVGNYAAVDEDRSSSSPSLLDTPVQDLKQSLNSPQRNSVLEMLRTTSNSSHCPPGNILRTGSNRYPVQVMNHGEGVIELVDTSQTNRTQERYKAQNLSSYELRTLPATKDSEVEEFLHPQRIPYSLSQHERINVSDKSLQKEFSSGSSIASSNVLINRQLQLCLKSEKPPLELLGSDSAPVILHPDSPVYVGCLEELKKCVYDPNQYLQRCIAMSTNNLPETDKKPSPTQTNNNNMDLEAGYNKTNEVSQIQSKNKPKLNMPSFISGDYVCPTEGEKLNTDSSIKKEANFKKSISKLPLKKSSEKVDTRKSCTKHSSKEKISDSSKLCSQKDCSKSNKENVSSAPLQKSLSKEIQDGVSKIVISVSKSRENVKQGVKKKRGLCGTKEDLILVPITTSQSLEGSDRTYGDKCPNNSKSSRLLTEDKIIHWLQQSKHDDRNRDAETKQTTKEVKRRTSASYNARKGNTKRRRKNRTLKLILEKLQALLKASSTTTTDLTRISDSGTNSSRGKPGAMSSIVLSILMDSVKEGFLKGVSSATERSELDQIQKALSAPNSVYMMDILLEKLCQEDLFEESDDLVEIEGDFDNEENDCVSAEVSKPLVLKALPNIIPDEATHDLTNLSPDDVAISGQSSTLANYLGSETSSDKSENQTGNDTCITHRQPAITRKERLRNLKRKLSPKSIILANRVQVPIVNKLYMEDFHHSVMPRENLYFDFDDAPVFDITPDPPTAVSIQMTKSEISETSLKSSVYSKPPLHPRSSKGNKKTGKAVVNNAKSKNLSEGHQETSAALERFDKTRLDSINKREFDESPLQLTQFSTQYSYALVGENAFPPCQKDNTCFSEQMQYSSPSIQDEKSLQWIKYTAPSMIYNKTVDVQNAGSKVTNKKDNFPLRTRVRKECAMKTPESFFKAYRYSQKYRSSMCNGRCLYSDPRIYTRPCSRCRRSKAESLSLEYMESILKDALSRFYKRAGQRRYPAMRSAPYAGNRPTTPQKMPFYKNPPAKITQLPVIKKETGKENFPSYGPKAQISKSFPPQVVPKPKHKERPQSPQPFSESNNKTTVVAPVKQKTMTTSSSAANYSDKNKKSSSTLKSPKSKKGEHCTKKSHDRTEIARQPKSQRSKNRISALALPSARYLEETKDRYKNVLKKGKLEWLDEMMVIRKNVQSRARKSSTITSSSSYQDLLSSIYSEISITEPHSLMHCQRASNVKSSKRKITREEKSDLEYGTTQDLNTETFGDTDTVTFGRYVFIGVGQYHQATNSPINADNPISINLKMKHDVNNNCEKTKPPLTIRKIKTDHNIPPGEKCIRHRAGPMRAEDHVRIISDNSQSDNMICPQKFTYRVDEPPLEMCTTSSATRQGKDIAFEQRKIKDLTMQRAQREICSNYVSHLGSMTLTLLEFNVLNQMPSILVNSLLSSPYLSESLINQVRIRDQLERKLSEGSYGELEKWKKPLNVSTSEKFLSSDSATSQVSNKSTEGSCLSMHTGIHRSCIERVIDKIRSLFSSETEISDSSDSGSFYMCTPPECSDNISTPEFISSISNTDASTPIITDHSGYHSHSSISEKTATDANLDKLNGKTVIEIGMNEGTSNSEIVLNFNNNSYTNKDICKDVRGNNTYSMICKFHSKEDNEAIRSSSENNLQIEVSYDINNSIIISFVSQYETNTSSDNHCTDSNSSIYFDRSKIYKITSARKSILRGCYKIYEAQILCPIKEKSIRVIWDRTKLMEISEKLTVDINQLSRYPIEQLREITVCQIFHFEFPHPAAEPEILENIFFKVNSTKSNTTDMLQTSLYEMISSEALYSQSTNEIFPTESCADYQTVSDIFYHDVSPTLVSSSLHTISNIHALVESCSLTSVNSVFSLPFVKSLELISSAANVSTHDIINMPPSDSSNTKIQEINSDIKLTPPLNSYSSNYIPEVICTSLQQETEEADNPDANSKSLDFSFTSSEQDDQNELFVHDLTTPDTVKDVIAAFTHTPNEDAAIVSHVVEPTQFGVSPSNNFEDILEAMTNLNLRLKAEEESFTTDLSTLENFIETLTSTSTLNSSFEEFNYIDSQTVGVRHVRYEGKILEVPSTYEMLQDCYFMTQFPVDEEIPNFLDDLKKYVNNEQHEHLVHMEVNSRLSGDELSDARSAIPKKMLENFFPDDDTRLMLQNILSEILEDVINIEDDQVTERLLTNNTENMPQTDVKDLFPPTFGNKMFPITEIVDQIKKELILDEKIKDKINILGNIVHQDSTATQKLVNKITTELSLIPREEMELFMTQTFGLGPSEFSLDNIYNRMYEEAITEVDTQYEEYGNNDISLKTSDLAISHTVLLELEREISKMEQMLEDVTGNSSQLSAEILDIPASSHTSGKTTQTLDSSQNGLQFTKTCNEKEIIELDDNTKEQLTSASEDTLCIATRSNESGQDEIQATESSPQESELEENIIFLRSVMNSEQRVLSGAGDGIVLQNHEAHFSTWTVLSSEDLMSNTLLGCSINVQRSSVSVAVSSSVADYSVNSATASVTDITDLSISDPKEKEINSITDPQEEDYNSSIDTQEDEFSSSIVQECNSNAVCSSENGNLFPVRSSTSQNRNKDNEKSEVKNNSLQTGEKPKSNLMMSRHTKAFATVYFILFSLIFGGLALQPECQ